MAKRHGREMGRKRRREMLDHVIPLNEEHLWRLVRNYVDYDHIDRLHDGLAKDAPHRRYAWRRAA